MKLHALGLSVYLVMIAYSFSSNSNSATATPKPTEDDVTTEDLSTKKMAKLTKSAAIKVPKWDTTQQSKGDAKPTSSTSTNRKTESTSSPNNTSRFPKGKSGTSQPTTSKRKTKPIAPRRSKPKIASTFQEENIGIKILCASRSTSCSKCIDGPNCFYCDSDVFIKCNEKTSDFLPTNCKGNHWYWKQCKIQGSILIIVVPIVAGVLLIMFGCGCYCCCCRRSSASRNIAMVVPPRQQLIQLDHDTTGMRDCLLQNMADDNSEPYAY